MNKLSTASSLEKMIRQQLIDRGIHDKSVLEAIRKVPREQFFPQDIREQARRGQGRADSGTARRLASHISWR